jgi:mobilome CxxCx(11)CxxC protein
MGSSPAVDLRIGGLHQKAYDAFATARIFAKRAQKYNRLLRFLTFWGFVIPLGVGAISLANLYAPAALARVIAVAGVLSIGQIVFALWSVTASWADSLEYASSSTASNYRLSSQFTTLATESAVILPADFDIRYADLKARDEIQNASDDRQSITSGELEYGTRAALIYFGLTCRTCNKTPGSIRMPFWGKRCPTCGGKLS